MSLENFIIKTFFMVDEISQELLKGRRLRQRGFYPKLSDAEVITMEIVGEFLGIDTDKGIWSYFREHWLDWFPQLGSRSNFSKQASNLHRIKKVIHMEVVKKLNGFTDCLHMADGFPMPACHFRRARSSKVFKGIAVYGYCASKAETYYGFKGNLLINSEGIIADITVTGANIDERESLWDIIDNIQGLLIADKGLIGEDYQKQIRAHTRVNLQTPTRSNMEDPRGEDANSWIIKTRRLVETVIGQPTERFNIEKIRARDVWHMGNRIIRKILSHTVAALINKGLGNDIIKFEQLGIT